MALLAAHMRHTQQQALGSSHSVLLTWPCLELHHQRYWTSHRLRQ